MTRMSEADLRAIQHRRAGQGWHTAVDLPQHAPQPRRGRMNKAEQAYYTQVIEPMMRIGEITWAAHEPLSIILVPPSDSGDKSLRYVPDWLVVYASGRLHFTEVKGFERRWHMDRWKMASEKFWWADWSMVRLTKDGWETLRYRPAQIPGGESDGDC